MCVYIYIYIYINENIILILILRRLLWHLFLEINEKSPFVK